MQLSVCDCKPMMVRCVNLLYTVWHKKLLYSYWYHNFAKLCHTFYQKDAHENIPSVKTENPLIGFEAASD